jgi:hypothetical protein
VSAQTEELVQVEVTLTEFAIELSQTDIPANTPVQFVVTNQGQVEHQFVLEPVDAQDQPLTSNGEVTKIDGIGAGETVTATWTISEPGQYQVACHIPGHDDAGMTTQINVSAAAGQAQQGATGTVTATVTTTATVAATETPAATGTAAPTGTAAATAGAAQSGTATPTATGAVQPQNLPTTGGNNLPLLAMILALGVIALIAGAVTLTRQNR